MPWGREAAASASLYIVKSSNGGSELSVRTEWIGRRTPVGESGRHGNVVPTMDPRTVTQHRPYLMLVMSWVGRGLPSPPLAKSDVEGRKI